MGFVVCLGFLVLFTVHAQFALCKASSREQKSNFTPQEKKEKTPGAKMSMLEIRNIHFISLAEWHLHQSRQINCKNKATL